ncbi:hypothetical protein [Bacillus sp. CGMCC 1.16541]|uniref:hypothetical protein n=1 Tax=Bacillus sp. CGMCC 1.16541 TaxID=2185143 RepID=UPI000D727245|nr:hypothetical protein [Bacillus sp. CGMCC 1.16541]
MEIKELLDQIFNYDPTIWRDRVSDPEGDITHPGTKFTARRGNKLEDASKLAHDRLNNVVIFIDELTRQQKNLRLEFLLLKASVTSGLTSNIFVENFETTDDIVLINGFHDPADQKLYIR